MEGEEGGQKRLAGKLRDEDICLSLMDKIQGEQGREEERGGDEGDDNRARR